MIPEFDLLDRTSARGRLVEALPPTIRRKGQRSHVVERDDLPLLVEGSTVPGKRLVVRDRRDFGYPDEAVLAVLIVERLRRYLGRLDRIREPALHLLGLGVPDSCPGILVEIPLLDLFVKLLKKFPAIWR